LKKRMPRVFIPHHRPGHACTRRLDNRALPIGRRMPRRQGPQPAEPRRSDRAVTSLSEGANTPSSPLDECKSCAEIVPSARGSRGTCRCVEPPVVIAVTAGRSTGNGVPEIRRK
jgi:hypothetical protein